MSEENSSPDSLDWYSIPKGKTWFDEVGRRIIINAIDRPIKIGYGHNKRMIELVAIAYSEESESDPELDALKGEIEEE